MRLVLIDGNALLHRAYHATPPLTTSKGELVNAVYGFSSMLLKVLQELHPEYLAVAWDTKAPTFRHGQFEKYKATRRAMDESLSSQFERAYEVLRAFNIPEFKLAGFEADDLVGALTVQSAKCKVQNLEVVIMTGDRDIMQLISKNVKVFMSKKTLSDIGLYGEEEFAARFGFAPKNLVDYKGLAGDQSDNIPGVPGIGETTATKLIQKYGDMENIYKHLKELPERLQKLLEKGKKSAFMSKKLATIETKVPIKLDLKKCLVRDFDPEKVKSLFEGLEFKSLISRIPSARGPVGLYPRPMSSLDAAGTRRGAPAPATPRDAASLATLNVTEELDKQVTLILQKMSTTGIIVDLQFLKGLSKDWSKKLQDIEQQIYSIIGHQVNLNSPKQLQVVLFDELKLPVVRKTKTGRSTDEDTLRELAPSHPMIPLLLQYRQLFKLVSTYVDALPRFVGSDGRVHSTFNVEGAATGRLSSQNPNLQNIPVKGEMGGEIRKAFVAPIGKILLAADYSQIELRILAHLAQDPGLIKAFNEGLDIHAATASKIFNVPVEKVTKEQRMVGKTMNFATLYGQGAHALARQLGVDYATAQKYIEEYFAQFPKVRVWKAEVLENAKRNGYVETLWGRKRYIPELSAANRQIQAFGERAAINHPVQGTAADMIKKAMVEIDKSLLNIVDRISGEKKTINDKRLTINGLYSMILQVHDELLFECIPDNVGEVG
ncbi:hypothetical protein A2617_01335, partial [Candidatus Daviesbacteria bacterium RIFOXYD1_FULL_41_10]